MSDEAAQSTLSPQSGLRTSIHNMDEPVNPLGSDQAANNGSKDVSITNCDGPGENSKGEKAGDTDGTSEIGKVIETNKTSETNMTSGTAETSDTSNTDEAKPFWLTLTLVRHGQSEVNVNPQVALGGPDGLTEFGRSQVARLGAELANTRIDVLLSSKLLRAVQTCYAIFDANETPDIILKSDNLYQEQVHGKTIDDLIRQGREYEAGALLMSGHGNHRQRGPPDCETLEDVERRCIKAMTGILQSYGRPLSDPQWGADGIAEGVPHVVLVSHNVFLIELVEVIMFWNGAHRYETDTNFGNATWRRLRLKWDGIPKDAPDDESVQPVSLRKGRLVRV